MRQKTHPHTQSSEFQKEAPAQAEVEQKEEAAGVSTTSSSREAIEKILEGDGATGQLFRLFALGEIQEAKEHNQQQKNNRGAALPPT